MNQKMKFTISILLGVFFLAAYVSGKLIRDIKGMRDIHSAVSTIALLLTIAHIVGYFPMIKAQAKCFFVKNKINVKD